MGWEYPLWPLGGRCIRFERRMYTITVWRLRAWVNQQVKRKHCCHFVVSECDCRTREQARRANEQRVCAWQSTKPWHREHRPHGSHLHSSANYPFPGGRPPRASAKQHNMFISAPPRCCCAAVQQKHTHADSLFMSRSRSVSQHQQQLPRGFPVLRRGHHHPLPAVDPGAGSGWSAI